MKKIVEWLESCGYEEKEAKDEAEKLIRANQWDGVEMCSRDFAIQMILEDLEF